MVFMCVKDAGKHTATVTLSAEVKGLDGNLKQALLPARNSVKPQPVCMTSAF